MIRNLHCRSWIIYLACLFWIIYGVGSLPFSLLAQGSPASTPSVVVTPSTLFEFHSEFWMNLHHFLYVQARAHLKTPDSQRRAVTKVSSDLAAIDKLSYADQRLWKVALTYYEQNLASQDVVVDQPIVGITNLLAMQGDSPSLK